MADVGDILGPRRAQMRAATFALSAFLVCLALTAILLITWRTHLNNPTDQGVRTWIEEKPKPKPLPPVVRVPPPSRAIPAEGSPSDIPNDAVLAQMLACFGADRDKHPECGPRWSAPQLAASGPAISPRSFSSSPGPTIPLGFAIRFPDPPPPSKSPEEICEAGLIDHATRPTSAPRTSSTTSTRTETGSTSPMGECSDVPPSEPAFDFISACESSSS